jgi:prepilin-type N-terminal cleavage/methylation domain-containing protein
MCRQRENGRARRGGYTLLEVLLAMAIAVMLLAGLYAAMSVQLHHAEAGREVVQQATLARALLSRIRQDITAATNLPDASRYRLQQTKNNSQGGGSGQSGAAGTTGAGGTSTPAAGAGGGTNAGTTNNSGTSASDPSTTSGGLTAADGSTVTWVYGIQGDSATLNLFVSKLPRELLTSDALTGDMPVPLVSDLRRISYWMADSTNGLARQEVKVETAQDLAALPPAVSDESTVKYTPEVHTIQFSYFDGTNWQESWDSTTLGADGITPIGPPRAVAVRIEVVQAAPGGGPAGERVKAYRHVVFIPSANGATTMQQPTGNSSTTTGSGN